MFICSHWSNLGVVACSKLFGSYFTRFLEPRVRRRCPFRSDTMLHLTELTCRITLFYRINALFSLLSNAIFSTNIKCTNTYEHSLERCICAEEVHVIIFHTGTSLITFCLVLIISLIKRTKAKKQYKNKKKGVSS